MELLLQKGFSKNKNYLVLGTPGQGKNFRHGAETANSEKNEGSDDE